MQGNKEFRWDAADAFLFDIDGTLLTSHDAVHYYAFHNAVRDVFGVTSSIEGVPIFGNTDSGILRAVLRREGVPDADIEAAMPRMLRQMCDEVAANAHDLRTEPCAGVIDVLTHLRERGKLLGVASGNLERVGWLKLEACALHDYFSFGAFSDQYEQRADLVRAGIAHARKLLGNSAHIHIIGDTPADIAAARAVGAPVIVVATGAYAAEILAQHAPDACFATCADMLAAARS
jgi:phosphoglycolate phosphatase